MTAEPMTTEELDAIQQRTDAYGRTGPYGYVINDIEYQGNWVHDIHRLLGEVDRLRAELDSMAKFAEDLREERDRRLRSEGERGVERDALAAKLAAVRALPPEPRCDHEGDCSDWSHGWDAGRNATLREIGRVLDGQPPLRVENTALAAQEHDPLYWFRVANDMERHALKAREERDDLAAKLDAVHQIEPTLRRIVGDGTRSEIELVDAVDELIGRALDATPEAPRPPVQSSRGEPRTVQGSTDKGTGVPGPEKPAQEGESGYTAAELISRTLVLPFGTRHNRGHIREIAEHIDNETRPVHYREAAAILHADAEHQLATAPDALAYARAEGVREAAARLAGLIGDTDA